MAKPFKFNPGVTAFTFNPNTDPGLKSRVPGPNTADPGIKSRVPGNCVPHNTADPGIKSRVPAKSAVTNPPPVNTPPAKSAVTSPQPVNTPPATNLPLTSLAQLQDVYSLNSYEKPRILRHFIDAGLTRLHFNVWVVDRNNKVKAQKESLGIVPRFVVDPPEIKKLLDSIADVTDDIRNTLDMETIDRDNAAFIANNTRVFNEIVPITNIRAFTQHSSTYPLNAGYSFLPEQKTHQLQTSSSYNRCFEDTVGTGVPLNLHPPGVCLNASVNGIIQPAIDPQQVSVNLKPSKVVSKPDVIKPSVIKAEPKLVPIIEVPEQQDKIANVFIDYSNLLVGLRSSWANTREENSRKHINVARLCNIINKSTETTKFGKKIVAGSNIAEFTCMDWKRNGYVIKQMVIPAGIKEKFVDEALHSCISALLLAEDAAKQSQILVICTGDGNETEGTNTFPNLADAAARLGWTVIVWSWSYTLSRKFKEVYESYPDRVIIKLLDEHTDYITMTTPTGGLTPIPKAPPKKYS